MFARNIMDSLAFSDIFQVGTHIYVQNKEKFEAPKITIEKYALTVSYIILFTINNISSI